MAPIPRHSQVLRETGLLILFLLLLFSYSGKTILRTQARAEKKTTAPKEINAKQSTIAKSSQQFFKLKPRLFPLPLPGRKPKSHATAPNLDAKQQKAVEEQKQLDFALGNTVPWYQFYYFPGESDDYSIAG